MRYMRWTWDKLLAAPYDLVEQIEDKLIGEARPAPKGTKGKKR